MRWRYRETVLALCTVAFFATMVARLVISPVVPAIVAEFEVSNTVVGLALTGLWMAYALSQFPSGILADRYGERLVILVAVWGTAVTSLLLALSPNYPAFLLVSICLGGLAGLHYSVGTTLLTRTYRDIGTAIGLHNGGAPAAGLLAPVAAAWVGVQYGWRPAVALGALVAIPAAALFAWKVEPTEPRRPEQPMRERVQVGPVRELLSRPSIAFTVCLSVLCAFVWQGTASFLPTFVIEHRGGSPTLAGVVFSAYFVVQGVVQVGVGALSDRIGRDRTAAGCMVAGIVGFSLFVLGSGLPSMALAVLLVGTGLSWSAAVLPRFMDHLSDAERSAGFGLVRTVYMVIGSLGSVGVGLVADTFGWAVSFGMLVAFLSIVLCALVTNRVLDLGY